MVARNAQSPICLSAILSLLTLSSRFPSLHPLPSKVSSMVALGCALLYYHVMRPTKHAHVEKDWRLLYMALSQLVPAGLIVYGTRQLPLWLLEGVGILCTTLAFLCAGHKSLKGF